MTTTLADRLGAPSQTITVAAIPAGSLEFLTARLRRHGGSARLWKFPDRGLTEIRFGYPCDPQAVLVCRAMVVEWCGANFAAVPLRDDVDGRHRAHTR